MVKIPFFKLEVQSMNNDDTYNLIGFISKNGSERIPVIRCGDNDKW